MRLLLKIIALPFILILSVLVPFLDFLFALSTSIFVLASTVLGLLGLVSFIAGNGTVNSMVILIVAFLVSPFGLPALADYIIEKFYDINCSLKSFLTS